jgi:uncharacterized Zn-binding protein involved in type VI secretion
VIRSLALLLLALGLAAPSVAAGEPVVHLTFDGRPVDRAGGIAVARGGVVYADVVDLSKAFDGLLTAQGHTVVVTVAATTATFTAGSRTAQIQGSPVALSGAPFFRHGDLYVPLDAFVVRLAGARLRVNARRSRADIYVNANPLS